MARNYHLTQTGEETQEAINKILALDIATPSSPGLMSGEDKAVLDALPSDVANKANKVSGATAGHLASLDSGGNLSDSGKSASDFATKAQGELADSAYQKPSTGIPASDLASGVIPDVSQFITKSVNDLTNYYLKSETYTKAEVQTIVDAIKGFEYEVVAVLPTASADTMHKIYLVPSSDPQLQNIKDEYITIGSGGIYSWEQIGSTAIDLTSLTEAEIDTIWDNAE